MSTVSIPIPIPELDFIGVADESISTREEAVMMNYADFISNIAVQYCRENSFQEDVERDITVEITSRALLMRRKWIERFGRDNDYMGLALLTIRQGMSLENERPSLTTPQANPQSASKPVKKLSVKQYRASIARRKINAALRDEIDDNCPICLETFKLGRTVHITKCGHHYHPRCLQHNVCKSGSNKCPICRTPILQ